MKRLLPILGAALFLAGCSASAETPTPASSDHYPLTVENCGEQLTFASEPQRVMLLESAPVPTMAALGLMDRVVSRAGTFSPEYYDDTTLAAIEKIPLLADDVDASGHLIISSEAVVSQAPDLVMGEENSITRESLRDAGAEMLIQNVYCPNWTEDASFAGLYEQVRVYGTIFDKEVEAEALITSLERRVAEASHAATGETIAVLYPSVGGGPLYAYGSSSMATPQVEALGFTNVFADQSERVFEVSIEELLKRNPDHIVVLYQDSTPAAAAAAVTELPGAEALHADIYPHLFNFTEPPSPLSVTGLEQMNEYYFGH